MTVEEIKLAVEIALDKSGELLLNKQRFLKELTDELIIQMDCKKPSDCDGSC